MLVGLPAVAAALLLAWTALAARPRSVSGRSGDPGGGRGWRGGAAGSPRRGAAGRPPAGSPSTGCLAVGRPGGGGAARRARRRRRRASLRDRAVHRLMLVSGAAMLATVTATTLPACC
ncbi:hypothetical protein HBB16_20735 [Pseudonocardia sp. MCCB 268]|nr:hypothetical protein [Pseudonocardia cytotoxica]